MKKIALIAALTLASTAPAWSAQSFPQRMEDRGRDMGSFLGVRGDRVTDTLTYPFRAVGRTANSLVHSPSIAADLARGDRELRSRDGKFLGRKDGKYDRGSLFD